jgi:uncharacterized protein YcaQ
VCRNPLRVSRTLLRRALLARLGLLAWRGGRGLQGEGAPWREVHRGPEGAARALRQLEAVQLNPVAVIERNHHLVLWNRVGGYARVHLEALYHQRSLFEYWAQERCLLPLEDYPVFAARRRPLAVGDPQLRAAVALVRARLASKGPLPARALDSGGRVEGAWGSSRKATSHALEMLWDAGEVVVAFRQGEERYFALAEHWLPRELLGQAADESARVRKYLRAYGVVDLQDPRFGWRRMPAAERRDLVARLLQEGELIPLEMQGTRRRYGLHPSLLPFLEGLEGAEVLPEVFLLPPLDNLLWRRERVRDLFGLDYRWELYLPPARRRYGPYALPVLEGDRFIALLDARLNRAQGVLVVERVFWLEHPLPVRADRLWAALGRLAGYLGAQLEMRG